MTSKKKTTLKLGDEFGVKVKVFCDKKGYTLTGLVKRLLKEEMERDPVGK